MDIKEIKKLLASFCVATLVSGAGVTMAGNSSG